MSGRPCARCAPADELALEGARELAALLPSGQKAPPGVRAARLAACAACGSLRGGVCLQCGCYVDLRAARAAMGCPHPAGARWPA